MSCPSHDELHWCPGLFCCRTVPPGVQGACLPLPGLALNLFPGGEMGSLAEGGVGGLRGFRQGTAAGGTCVRLAEQGQEGPAPRARLCCPASAWQPGNEQVDSISGWKPDAGRTSVSRSPRPSPSCFPCWEAEHCLPRAGHSAVGLSLESAQLPRLQVSKG